MKSDVGTMESDVSTIESKAFHTDFGMGGTSPKGWDKGPMGGDSRQD